MTDCQQRAAVASLVTVGVALLAAGCANTTPRSPTRGSAVKYLTIAQPADRELDHETELTSTAAAATSLRELRGYQRRLDVANKPVEDAVRVIRGQLDLPPPDTS